MMTKQIHAHAAAVSISPYLYVCMYVCMYVSMYVLCVCVCVCLCVFVCVCVCIHIHIATYDLAEPCLLQPFRVQGLGFRV